MTGSNSSVLEPAARTGTAPSATARSAPAAPAAVDPTIVDRPFGIFNIELTNRCPLRCVMCARTNNMTRAEGLMDFELFRKVIDELVEANPRYATTSEVWLHHFGESLVHPQFSRFVAYASARGVYTCLSINPIMLTRKISLGLLRARPSQLYISLDGHDNESFEKIRGLKNAYERSKRHLLEFLRLKKAMGSKTRIVFSMIRFDMNRDSFEPAMAYWRGVEGIDSVMAKSFVTWDGNAEDVNRFSPTPQIKGDKVTCRFPFEKMTVTWDGDVVPCCYDYDKRYVLGSARFQTLAEIWNGAPMRKLRREFIDNNVTNPLCRNCKSLYGQE
jgi:radical SAM protein with 4Fe4S-binding SPASM domain